MRRSRSRGFTLIEVMVAFAIFALSIGAIFEVFAGATRRAERARENEHLWLSAQSLLSEFRARPAPWPAEEEGPHDDASGDVAWRVTVTPFDADTNPDYPWKAYLVTVRVGSQSSHRDVTLRSIELARAAP
jgi:general secretion pathway protein I